MRAISRLAGLALLMVPAPGFAELVETEIPNVTAEVAELRTSGGVTRLAIRYKNGGAKEVGTDRFETNKISIVDVKSKKKHAPIKDANNQFVAGPIGDGIGGGRIYVKLEPGQEGVAWTYFEPIPAGSKVTVEVPQMFPFEDVTVTEGTGALLDRDDRQEHAVRRARDARVGQARRSGAEGAPQAGGRAGRQRGSAQPVLRVQGRVPLRSGEEAEVSAAQGYRRRLPGDAARREPGRQELPSRLEQADPDEPHVPGAARRRHERRPRA